MLRKYCQSQKIVRRIVINKCLQRNYVQTRTLSAEGRKSKNLFSFQPKGIYDEDVARVHEAFKKQLAKKKDPNKEDPPELHAATLRKWIDYYFTGLFSAPIYQDAVRGCEHLELIVPSNDECDSDIKVLMHIPKHLDVKDDNVGIIYAHGGGVISGSADLYKPALSLQAIRSNSIMFNVDYDLAPEAKCPTQANQFYRTIKYISEHAERLGIDRTRLGISGESGGGYVCLAAMILLVSRNESHLVKAALPIVPMVSDYFFSDPACMTNEERDMVPGMRSTWRAIADDLEKQWPDPLLFPDKAPEDILKAMPPTIIFSAEFDMFVTETTRLAHRMRVAGSLMEFCLMPGVGHAHYFDSNLACHDHFHDLYSKAVLEYIIK